MVQQNKLMAKSLQCFIAHVMIVSKQYSFFIPNPHSFVTSLLLAPKVKEGNF